ncbi:5-methylthioribose kinase [Alkalibacillus filiformis]|uniref:5-methylthioribose kinase n=1 Tax=Alkalibacillus filiformis TaxID=200990 RepID=A0ABU0DV72_9BACI|nr:hypothetical protein [Alkalibacillus filiformis]MDQ0352357.1 5-methylthioribose kinase [Alkalibacillus filiformis]
MKKILLPLIVGLILGGSITVYASSNYFADALSNQDEQIKNILMEHYEDMYKQRGQQQHTDMMSVVQSEREAILDYFKPKIEELVHDEADQRREEHIKAIEQASNELIEDIYKMLEEELGYEIPRG